MIGSNLSKLHKENDQGTNLTRYTPHHLCADFEALMGKMEGKVAPHVEGVANDASSQ